jgi:hypothetical protein
MSDPLEINSIYYFMPITVTLTADQTRLVTNPSTSQFTGGTLSSQQSQEYMSLCLLDVL